MNPCTHGQVRCGDGAQCHVSQHRANCICPIGTQGNPLNRCISGQCQYNEDCADHESCDRLNRVCQPVCKDNTCGLNALCNGRNHQAICTCRDGTVGNPFDGCKQRDVPPPVECTSDVDCPSQKACFNEHCENPCLKTQACSSEQTCEVVDTIPLRTLICKCPIDMITDYNGKCKPIASPGCKSHSECSDSDQCIDGVCVLACRVEKCGINAICTSKNHRGICSCPPGYEGTPRTECIIVQRTPTPTFECTIDEDCPLQRQCEDNKCVNPCSKPNACGRNAFCHAENHRAVCRCPPNTNGNPQITCDVVTIPSVGCTSNSQCELSESCVNQRCVNPCSCGDNAECYVSNHHPVCTCKPGYSGNAQFGCFKLGCQSDNECNSDKTCSNGECINPCVLSDPCPISAICYAQNHVAHCKCPPGLEGNPLVKCERAECYSDYECPNTRACVDKRCVNPCAIRPDLCAWNAECFVNNHLANCRCPEQMPEGNPFSYCHPKQNDPEPICVLDSDCPSQLACINNICVNPCKELSPCAKSARCSVLDSVPIRTMVCTCPELFVPDNAGECKEVKMIQLGCSNDNECSDKEACIHGQCRDPCNCGQNAVCTVKSHRATCSCQEGYEGNPDIVCRTVGCRSDSECSSDKACINKNCVNPCLVDDPCGANAECFALNNRAQCRCRSGYHGDPRISCRIVGCLSNNECPTDKRCVNEQCVDPCLYDNICAPRAECKAQNHLAICKCLPGLIGNPYSDCKPEILAECIYDTDCPSTLACINSKCVDPCHVLEPCNLPSKCKVIPSAPVRTMICICPEGYISSGSGTCKPIESIRTIGCIADSDCAPEKACVNSVCKNPCNCGPHAECRIKDHKPVCTCEQGFEGNPEIECVKIGCRSDDECSGTHSCINKQCVPVCNYDTCGQNADCFGVNHRAICECRPGLTGDPKVSCIQVGCRSDSECPLDRACINSKCVNPCEETASCDINEICNVYYHRPECTCKPGFISDIEKGCIVQDEICHSDGDCPTQTACIRGECLNPCNITQPCGVNSICKVLDTLPVRTMVCDCLPGYQGNAAVQCDKSKYMQKFCSIMYGPKLNYSNFSPLTERVCPSDKIIDENGNCVCPPGTALNIYDECVICEAEKGYKIDFAGRCVCALDRGLIIDDRGKCICPEEHGYHLTDQGECVRVFTPECEISEDCPDYLYCNTDSKTCEDPCAVKQCGTNAFCNATNHIAVCQCITGYIGDAELYCSKFFIDYSKIFLNSHNLC